MDGIFQYVEFFINEDDGFLYGRPVNPFYPQIKLRGYPDVTFSNPVFRDFEKFVIEYSFQAFNDAIQPGIYHRDDISIIHGINNRYYVLKQNLIIETDASA